MTKTFLTGQSVIFKNVLVIYKKIKKFFSL